MARRPLVAITRPIPDTASALLRDDFEIRQWEGELPPSPGELDSLFDGADGAITLVTDTIDAALLDRHGTRPVATS